MGQTTSVESTAGNARISRLRSIGLIAGPLLFFGLLLLPVPDNLSPEGWRTAAIMALMATWWITEALPIEVTALLPLVLFPFLGILPIGDAASPYANPLIFLFLGGFILATGMQTWNLHRRIALRIVSYIGVGPSSIVLGFMAASALLSMWVSNTATALMMLPIGMSILTLARERAVFEERESMNTLSVALLLGIAYSCSIGGLGTIIGSPPNALMVGFMEESYGIEIGFAQWMMLGVPLVLLTLPVVWLLLTRWLFPIQMKELPGGRSVIEKELAGLGPMSGPEKKIALVFGLTATFWMIRPLLSSFVPGISDTGIAMAGAILLFLIPVNIRKGIFLLSWEHLRDLPWGILILFGGGLSLASAITSSGLAEWIGNNVTAASSLPLLLMLGAVITLVIFLTEITSNTATAATFLPILASVAAGLGYSPLLFVLPATLAASCAFMMPVATPPNAIVFSSGLFTIPQMARAGVWFNLFFTVILTLFGYFVLELLFGI